MQAVFCIFFCGAPAIEEDLTKSPANHADCLEKVTKAKNSEE
jgi:hypothetical protein